MSSSIKLAESLCSGGIITKEQFEKASELQKKSPEQPIGYILSKTLGVSDKLIGEELARIFNLPYASKDSDLLSPAPDQDLQKLLSEEFCRKNYVVPLYRHMNALKVAMADPSNVVLLDNLRLMTNCYIQRLVASYGDVEYSIGLLFGGSGSQLKSVVEASYKTEKGEVQVKKETETKLTLDNLVASAEKAPVINLTDLLILQAVKDRASDIHIEPFEDRISIRFRTDGVLHEMPPPDKSMMLPLISRLKIISKMDISEKRLPQDGSFSATVEGRDIDFRVSTIPTLYGEKMVLRILDKRATSMDLSMLGMTKEELQKFRKYINKPYGLILVTGPTGSGKTTTLYSIINEVKGVDKNIITIEDPVEYQITGINQVNVKSSIGLTFATGLRAFLRQDPDIMLVGETRDLETAQICVRAALTGHMVFSTIHTNDAPSTVGRLVDIGVEPFFVGSSLVMIVAQRLVRKLCEKCKEGYKPSSVQLPEHFNIKSEKIFRAKGCEKCGQTGYSGRIPIFEILYMNEKLQELVVHRANTAELRDEARKNGMKTLEESAIEKVVAGLTTVEEVLRITMAGGF